MSLDHGENSVCFISLGVVLLCTERLCKSLSLHTNNLYESIYFIYSFCLFDSLYTNNLKKNTHKKGDNSSTIDFFGKKRILDYYFRNVT